MTPRRRNTDWIQFGILLSGIISLVVGGIYEQGRINQFVSDQNKEIQELRQDVKDLNVKVDAETTEFQHQMLALRTKQ